MRIALLTIILCLAALVVPARALPPQAGFPVAAEFFAVDDRPAFLAPSSKAPPGKPRPWVLFAPSLPNSPNQHEEWMLRQFLAAGVSIAGIDVGESNGNPTGRAHYTALGGEMVLIIAPGQGHTHWEGFFQCRELVEFVVKHAHR